MRRYHSNKSRSGVQRTYASFTLRWGGVVILLFVIYHLLHLTWNVIHPGGAAAEPYERVVNGFQIWSVVLAYTIAVIAVGFHVRHGIVERPDNTRSQYLEPCPTTPERRLRTRWPGCSRLASCFLPSPFCSGSWADGRLHVRA